MFSSIGMYTAREVPPSASGSSSVVPHRAFARASKPRTMSPVAAEFSLSTTTTRHGATLDFSMESNSCDRSSWRLKVTMTMAGRFMKRVVQSVGLSWCLIIGEQAARGGHGCRRPKEGT